jgi:hypothetical protein
MNNSISTIKESFNREIRTFERYSNDIHKSLLMLEEQRKELEDYVNGGGSLNFPSRPVENSTAFTVGMFDTPEIREVMIYALGNRAKELEEYIEISLTMALSHFITIFDSRYMDLISLFYEQNPKFLKDTTLENKLMGFSYKSFRNQLNSIQQNFKIDFFKLMGGNRVNELVEIRATRNLIVHNSGIVNDLYLSIVVASTFVEGQKRPLDITYFEYSTDLMQRFFAIFCDELEKKLAKN